MTLAEWLRTNERSQAWLARKLRVHEATISRWIEGTPSPPYPSKLAIQHVTGGAVRAEQDWT